MMGECHTAGALSFGGLGKKRVARPSTRVLQREPRALGKACDIGPLHQEGKPVRGRQPGDELLIAVRGGTPQSVIEMSHYKAEPLVFKTHENVQQRDRIRAAGNRYQDCLSFAEQALTPYFCNKGVYQAELLSEGIREVIGQIVNPSARPLP